MYNFYTALTKVVPNRLSVRERDSFLKVVIHRAVANKTLTMKPSAAARYKKMTSDYRVVYIIYQNIFISNKDIRI